MTRRILKRPALGFFAGIIAGGVQVSAYFTFGYATTYPVEGGSFVPSATDIINWALICFAIAALLWTIGLVTVGNTLWFILHKQGLRGPAVAIPAGCIAVYGSSLLVVPNSFADAFDQARLLLAASGGIVALTMERVAYGRPRPPPARSS